MARGGSILDVDYASVEREILGFIRRTVKDSGAKGVALGLSGGVDSAVVGALCVKALGKGRVVALLLSADFTPPEDIEDARDMASKWGVRTYEANVSQVARRLVSALPVEGTRISRANVLARVRMVLNYFAANSLGLLVAGTGDKSEDMLGFYTKFGDGGVDFLPIAHLYKTQVRKLGARLGIPPRVVSKPASPQLWPGHTAAQELPADYERLDPLLWCLFEAKMAPAAAAKRAGVGLDLARAVVRMHRLTAHKRAPPPMVRPW